MTVLEINGQHVDVDDSFMKLSPDEQTKTVNEIAGHITAAPDANDPRFADGGNEAASVLRGVPVLGAGVNRAGAAISAAVHPLTGVGTDAPTFGERYAKNLEQENAAHESIKKNSPILNAVSEGIGGTLALGGAAGAIPGAARVLGMTGEVLPAMRNAALSGAAISGADAVARGEDPSAAAAIGGLTGPAGVLLGKGAGKAFDAISEGVRGRPAVPTRFMDVNGEQVPIRESVETGSPDTSRTEQALLRAGQPAAVQGEEATQAAMAKAHSDLAAGLDPTATSPSATPLQAGDAVAGDLVSQEQARAAAEVARTQAAIADTAGIRGGLDLPGQPVAPHAPLEAGQAVSTGIRDRFTAARANTRAAYEAAGQIPGEFAPGRLLGAGEDIRMRLNSAPGNERVRISPETTPAAANALRTIDDEISQLRFTNDAARGERAITPADMEQVRKQLVIQRRIANNTARSTGNWEDPRAVGRVIDEFDSWLGRTVRRPGGFSGDADQYLQAQQAARQAHASERGAFSRRGPGDQVGSMMENIVGKYPGQGMSPEKIIRTVLGSPDSPGGAEHAVAALGHLRDTLGPQSPEWAALRKAAISHFTEPVPGGEAVPLTKQADRMLKFLGNERHSGQIFDAGERARLEAHAQTLRGAEDALPLKGTTEQKIAVLSGRVTGEAATGEQTLSAIKRDPQLARTVMNSVSPESRGLLKQALWREVSEAPEGMTAWGSQRIGQNIAKFLNTDLAREAFTPNERMLMKAIGDAHHRLVPIPGTTNPSGTAHMLTKIASGAKNQLLALFGFSHGGLPGAGVALALGKGLEWLGNRRAANQATRLFLGQQPKAPGVRFPQAIGAVAGQVQHSSDNRQR